jgi:hypothetical protein
MHPELRPAGDEDVRACEAVIDAEIATRRLPHADFGTCAWNILTVAEDVARLSMAGVDVSRADDILRVLGLVDGFKYGVKAALREASLRAKPSSERPDMRCHADRYMPAGRLVQLGIDHELARAGFINYWRRRATSQVSPRLDLIRFYPRLDGIRFAALDLLESLRGTKPAWFDRVTQWLRPSALDEEPLRLLATCSSETERGGINYSYQPPVASYLMERLQTSWSRLMPENWACDLGATPEITRLLGAMQAICAYHLLAVLLGARRLGTQGVGHESCVLAISRKTLIKRVSALANAGPEQAERFCAALTYGVGTRDPDPALQPIIELSGGLCLIAPFLFVTSSLERNFLSLVARAYPKQFDAASLSFSLAMTESLRQAFEAKGYATRAAAHLPNKDGGEIDLLVADAGSHSLAAFELRWMLRPAEPTEYINRDNEVQRKLHQADTKFAAVRKHLPWALGALGISAPDPGSWSTSSFLVVDGFLAGPRETHESKVVSRRTTEDAIAETDSLRDLAAKLEDYERLPQLGRHFEIRHHDMEIGGIGVRWYSVNPLPAGLARWSAARRHSDASARKGSWLGQ